MTLGALGLNGLRAEVDFAKSVQSVFEARCIDCHGSKKQKGDLRLDSLKAAASVIEPGKSGESELFKRITLPADHEDIMPPKGDPLSKEQIDGVIGQYGGHYSLDREEGQVADYLVDHSTYTYLIDQQGRVRFLFRQSDGPELMAAVTQQLFAE